MSWICKAQPELPIRLQTKSTMSELKKIDPRTQQIFTEFVSEDAPQKLAKYQDWSRVKIESINTRDMTRHLRETKKNFTDPDFPHHNAMLSRDFFSGEIEWVRVTSLIDNAVYSRQQSRSTLQNIRINRQSLQKALVLIARTSPSIYKEILSKTLNREGVYEFKIFRDGYIQNVVVDDYIPTHQGMPIFVGPVRMNEVYAMLLEKALAKACGSYQNIPDDAEEILEMIFCGPVHTSMITELREQDILGDKIRGGLEKRQLTALMSRRDPKIRNYGLNDNQVYVVINHYEIEWGGHDLRELQESKVSFLNQSNTFWRKNSLEKSLNYSRSRPEQSLDASKTISLFTKDNKQNGRQVQHIYECVSESKLSAWNGRFSLNDDVWNKVDPFKKAQLYKQIKANRSFLINETDIARLFEEVMIFQTNETNNKDWLLGQSHNKLPSFTRFEVTSNENIFIRVTTPSKIKQTVFLAKEVGGKQYQYVQSKFSSNSDKVEISVELGRGKYVLVVYHQWYVNRAGNYYVFLSSKSHITLEKGGLADHDFLLKAITSLERMRPANAKEDKEECTIRLELQRLGLAYLVLKPNNTKKKSFTLTVDKDRLKKEGWDMAEPYAGLSEVIVSEGFEKGETIIVLSKSSIDSNKRYYFPFAAFAVKK